MYVFGATGNYYGLKSISRCEGQASSSTASSRSTKRSIVGQSHFRLGCCKIRAHRVHDYHIQVFGLDNARYTIKPDTRLESGPETILNYVICVTYRSDGTTTAIVIIITTERTTKLNDLPNRRVESNENHGIYI